jgi:hypothetical protein
MRELYQHLDADPATIDAFVRLVTEAISEAYRVNAERYQESVGDDSLTFGNNIWRNSYYFIREAVRDFPGVQISQPKNSLVVRWRGVEFHTCKAGFRETDDVRSVSFDGSRLRSEASSANDDARLFDPDEYPGVYTPMLDSSSGVYPVLVFAHCGNPRDGLCSVDIGAPSMEQQRDGSYWHWLHRVHEVHRLASVADSDEREVEKAGQSLYLDFDATEIETIEVLPRRNANEDQG